MPGRISLFTPQPALEDRFNAVAADSISPSYNIPPDVPLATIQDITPDEITHLRWGWKRQWGIIKNARGESVRTKGTFEGAFADSRCLVLADGFYEWKGQEGKKQPYRIQRLDQAPFAFAGLWEHTEPTDGERGTVSLITTEPNAVVEPIHGRMPVILAPAEESVWLNSDDLDEVEALLDPYPAVELEAYEISTKINNPKNDSPDVIEPLDSDQSGLDDFD